MPRLLCLGLLALAGAACAQNLLPNPGFENGAAGSVPGWRLAEGAGEWTTDTAAPTNHILRVRGNGDDQAAWRAERVPLQPGALHALHFRARRGPDASGGTAVAGTGRVNRDFPLDSDWRAYSFTFREPDDATNDFVRLGQWHVKGAVEFDDAELLPVLASHTFGSGTGTNRFQFGESESIQDSIYRFAPNFGWSAANFHRPLWRATANFNSDRWVFSPGAEVVYRFALADLVQTNARVSVGIGYHVAGALRVEASRDGEQWTALATFDGKKPGGACDVPADLMPATNVFVRLKTPDANANLQVNRCDYEARVNGSADLQVEGRTDFLDELQRDPSLLVDFFHICTTRGQGLLQFYLTATSHLANQVKVESELSGPSVRSTAGRRPEFILPPHFATCPVVKADQPGDHELHFTIKAKPDRTLLETRTIAHLSHLYDPRAGHRLLNTDDMEVWWCESGWKVARAILDPPGADVPVQPVTVSAAKGEFESAQVLLRPATDKQLVSATTAPFVGSGGQAGPITVRVDEVGYVHAEHPTDGTCEADWYPDPLPPLKLPRDLKDGENLPLWLTFHVPVGTKAGDYTGELVLQMKGSESALRIPLAVHVYDFELPRETHLHSALGLGASEINRYHKLTNRADQVTVFEKYLQNFAEHRISPYSFYDYAPMDVRFVGEGTNKHAQLDFAKFDAAAKRWLDDARFSTFQLPLQGMGGGTFYERSLGELAGFKEGTPEHARLFKDYLGQIEQHLRGQGWLDKAFIYWFDEPDKKDFPFVVEGMKRLKAAAPGFRRMLTKQPEPELIGNVEIWCGLTPEWTPERVRARREAGEEVWWYICTGPKAPYVTEFIDHPGTELRLWPWQSWQYGVTGLLVWATTFWTSPTGYPNSLQNPWEDPMSWVSGYGTPAGTRSPWGNGDGRFLYPPRRDPNTATTPDLDGPINSIRWENLRDGMEDYEYFWLLDQEVKRLEAAKGDAKLIAEGKQLLVVPPEVSKDLTHFTTDPRPMLEHREKIARMIERLQTLK